MSDLVERLRSFCYKDTAEAADRIEQLEIQLAKAESALVLIATPMRPDGTWNRDREACRVLAAETLEALK